MKNILKTTLMDVAPRVGSKRFPYPQKARGRYGFVYSKTMTLKQKRSKMKEVVEDLFEK